MRVLANYSFDAPRADGVFARCVAVVADWLRRKGIDPAAAPPGVPTAVPDRFGRPVRVERDLTRSDTGTATALRLTEPGDGLEFGTTVELAEAGESVHLFVRLAAGAVGFAPPTNPSVFAPACLPELLAAAPWAFHGTPVPVGVMDCVTEKDAFRLRGLLVSPTRQLPIVAVSYHPDYPINPALAADLAQAAVGLVAVAGLAPDVSWDLTERLGKQWSCYQGAIRLYWPGLHLRANPFTHPLWMWDKLAGLAPTPGEAAHRFVGQLKRTLMDRSVEGVRRPGVFDAVRDAAQREAHEARVMAASTPDDFRSLANEYAAENDKLRAEVERLKEVVGRLEAARPGDGDAADVLAETEYPPATPAEAVARARERFADVLAFGRDADRGAAKLAAGAGPPRKVLQYLQRLAELARARRTNAVGKDPLRWLVEHGVAAGPEGETVRGGRTTRQARTWDWGDGTARYFDLHLKPNESTTKDKCVRIYAEWCDDRRKYVVGWVGPHPD